MVRGGLFLVLVVFVVEGGLVVVFVDFVLDDGVVERVVLDGRIATRERQKGHSVIGPGLHRGPLDHVIGVGHRLLNNHRREQSERLMQARQMLALLIEDIEADRTRHPQRRFAAALEGLDFQSPQRRQGAGFHRPHSAGAGAVFADVGRAFEHAASPALTADLHQAERADLAHLDAGAIVLQTILELLFDRPVVLGLIHVDEVDDDQARQVAQPKLARGLFSGFHIGLERRRLDVPLTRRAPGVHIDRDEGFGLVDHQVAARAEGHHGRVDLTQMVFDPVMHEQRRRIAIGLNLLGLGWHQHPHEVSGFLEGGLAFDPDLVDVLVIEVADGALHQILFLVDQGRRDGMQGLLADVLPEAQQIVVVALDFGLGALGAGRADDQTHAVGHIQAGHDTLQALAICCGGDLAGDAAAAGGVGHQHAVAARQRQIGGQRRALVAALFLDDLDEHDLAPTDDFLNLVTAHQPPATPCDLFVHHIIIVIAARGVGILVVVIAARARLGTLVVVILGLFTHQRFAIREGDLIVVRVDFVEGQEAMAVAAILHERRLQRRFDPRHLGEVDIPAKLLSILALEIKLFNTVSVDHHHARLFGVGSVDQHDLGHLDYLRGARGRLRPGAACVWDERARLPRRRRRRRLGGPWGQVWLELRSSSCVFLGAPWRTRIG